MVVAIVLVLVLVLVPGRAGNTEPAPLLFIEDDEMYLAVGAESIQLEDAAMVSGYLNGLTSVDGKTLYYLADVSSKTGEGDLMRVALGNANAEPERIAEDVYAARISSDGKKVLYLSNYDESTCDLYVCSPGGKATMIEEGVSDWVYGFSPNGSLVYYATMDKSGDYTLYVYSGGESEEIEDFEDASLAGIFLDDSGRMLYKVYSREDYDYTLYLYENGKSERINRDDDYIYTYLTSGKADEFLYTTGDSLYYYTQGEEERISKSFSGIWWVSNTGVYDPREGYGKRFIFGESSGSSQTIYEVNLPGDPVKIAKTDGSYAIEDSGRYAAYVSDDSLYLVKKSGNSWGDREKVCEDPDGYAFDESGKYLYYITLDRNGYSGDFCRLSLSSGEEEVLLDSVTQFLLSGDRIYAIDEDDEAYIIVGGDGERVEKDIRALYDAPGGLYMTDDNDKLYYYSDRSGETERVSSDASVTDCYGYIIGAFD